jgi:cbb3-type cytochrome oxidase subunit 3
MILLRAFVILALILFFLANVVMSFKEDKCNAEP